MNESEVLTIDRLAALPSDQWSRIVGLVACILGVAPAELGSGTPGRMEVPSHLADLAAYYPIADPPSRCPAPGVEGLTLRFEMVPRDLHHVAIDALRAQDPALTLIGEWCEGVAGELSVEESSAFVLGDDYALSYTVSLGDYCDDESDASLDLHIVVGESSACRAWIEQVACNFLQQRASTQAEMLSRFPSALREQYLEVLDAARAKAG